MGEYNDKSKTEVFDAFTEEKPIVRRAENDAYSRARNSAYSEDYYEEAEKKEKTGLIILIILITVLLCGAIIWGAYIFTGIEKDKEPPSVTEQTQPPKVVEEAEEETEEEEVVVKPDVVSYKIAFQSGTVEEEGGRYTARVNLYDSSMNKTDTRRLVIDENTEIREGKEKMSLSSFVYILKSLGSESFVCDARVDEKNGVLVSISYSKKDVEEKEEEVEKEENTSQEEPLPETETEEEPAEEENSTQQTQAPAEEQEATQTPEEETQGE